MEKKRTKFADQIIRRRKKRFFISVAALTVLVGLCYLFVWERVYTLKLADENAQTRRRVNALKERCQSLEFEINQLSSVKRIEDIARRELSLLPQREVQLASFTATSYSAPKAHVDSAKLKPSAIARTSEEPKKSEKSKDKSKPPVPRKRAKR